MKKSPQQRANLRVCMSCEWIYRKDEISINDDDDICMEEDIRNACPKCQWPTYGARFVYGDACYRYAVSQKPWKDKKLFNYEFKLLKEIWDSPGYKKHEEKKRMSPAFLFRKSSEDYYY